VKSEKEGRKDKRKNLLWGRQEKKRERGVEKNQGGVNGAKGWRNKKVCPSTRLERRESETGGGE